jgi:hypothetical protein
VAAGAGPLYMGTPLKASRDASRVREAFSDMSQVFHRPRTERVRKLRVFETEAQAPPCNVQACSETALRQFAAVLGLLCSGGRRPCRAEARRGRRRADACSWANAIVSRGPDPGRSGRPLRRQRDHRLGGHAAVRSSRQRSPRAAEGQVLRQPRNPACFGRPQVRRVVDRRIRRNAGARAVSGRT